MDYDSCYVWYRNNSRSTAMFGQILFQVCPKHFVFKEWSGRFVSDTLKAFERKRKLG